MAVARTQLRQDAQLAPSITYNDRIAMGQAALQTAAQSTEDDFNALRSVCAINKDTSGGLHWYDTPPAGLVQLYAGLTAQQQQPFAVKSWNYATIQVPSGQNYVVLSAANNQVPAAKLATGSASFGAVVAVSAQSGTAFAANELTVVAGADALHPKNKVLVVSSVDGSPVEDSTTRDIMGLIQAESTAQDQGTPNDTSGGNRVKISFVKIDYTQKQFIAADPADVGGKSVNYMYLRRTPLQQVPENGLGGDGAWVDNIGAADVTLQRAVANQAGAPVAVAAPILLQLASGQAFRVQNATGGQDYLAVTATGTGSAASVNTTTYAVTTTSAAQFSQGIQVAQGSTQVNVGVTAGQVDAAGLTVASTGSNPLKLVSGAVISFKDAFLAQSTFTSQSVNLAASPAEWTNYKTYYGETSIAAALVQAGKSSNHRLVYADVLPATVAANTNLTGAGSSANLSSQFPDYSTISDFVTNVKLMYNGVILRPGINQAAQQDWYPGTNRATGDVMLNFQVRGVAGLPNFKNDELALEVFGQV